LCLKLEIDHWKICGNFMCKGASKNQEYYENISEGDLKKRKRKKMRQQKQRKRKKQ